MVSMLPIEIVDYIYSFDDNKQKCYNQIICDLKVRNRDFINNYTDCMNELMHSVGLYAIYKLTKKMESNSIAWYLLRTSRHRKMRLFAANDLHILFLQRRYRELYCSSYFTNLYHNNISYRDFMKNHT